MKNSDYVPKTELIPLLIKYKKIFGFTFPLIETKNFETNDLIIKIKECLKTKTMYSVNKINIETLTTMTDEQLLSIVPLIKETLKAINYDYYPILRDQLDIIELRNNGKEFSFQEHLRAFIYSQLNNNKWGDKRIRESVYLIDNIFHHYDKNYLKVVNSDVLIKQLKQIYCSNSFIKQYMGNLSYNISIFEQIEKDYGSMDNFVLSNNPNDIANMFNDGKYKMKSIGKALTFEYLKKVGINTCKSSTQMERLFGSARLAIVKEEKATASEVISILKKLEGLTKIKQVELETIFQCFCLQRCASVCNTMNTRCNICYLKRMCNYGK